jgi:hypothetical protein
VPVRRSRLSAAYDPPLVADAVNVSRTVVTTDLLRGNTASRSASTTQALAAGSGFALGVARHDADEASVLIDPEVEGDLAVRATAGGDAGGDALPERFHVSADLFIDERARLGGS